MVDIREYHEHNGRSSFREWFDKLNSEASRKVTTTLYRMGLGNFSNTKSIGAGVYECKINFGPGYRVYFGKDAERIVILLVAGRNSGNRTTLGLRLNGGKTTSSGRNSINRKKRNEYGFDTRF